MTRWLVGAALLAVACAHAPGPAPAASVLAEAAALDAEAGALYAKGDYPSAVARARRALALKESVPGADPLSVGATLYQLGRILMMKGDLDEARAVEQRTLEIRRTSLGPDHPDVAACLNVLGAIASDSADYVAAAPLLQQALEIRQRALRPDDPLIASSLNNLAVVYERQGEFDTAFDLHQRAMAMRMKALGPEHPNVAWSLNNIAAIHRARGELAEARELFERALGIWERSSGADSPDVAVGLSAVAAVRRDQGDYSGALTLFERSLRIHEKAAGPDDLGVGFDLSELAEIHVALGDASGRPLAERALAIEERVLGPGDPNVADTLGVLVREARARGDATRAIELSRRSVAIIEKSVARNIDALTERQQIAYLASKRRFLDAFLSTPGVPDDEAYAHVLSWKGAAALIASARQLEAWTRQDRSEAAGQSLAELRRVRAQLAQLALSTPGDDEARSRLAERVAALSARERQLESELTAKSAGFRARAAFLTAGAKEICARLPKDSALVDYVAWRQADAKPPPPGAAPDRLTAFVLTPDGCRVRRVDLPASYQEIAKRTEAWRVAASALADGLAFRRGRLLRAAVFDPVVPAVGSARTLLVAPDGPVAAVSLGALPVGNDRDRALLEEYALGYLDSGKDLVRDAIPATSGVRAPLVVGGAEYGKAASGAKAQCALDFAPLPGARAEAEHVAQRLGPGTELLLGAAATERAFREATAHRRVLHVATHGFFLPAACATGGSAHPMLLSGLAFTPGAAGDPADDGLLTAADLATFDLRGTELVVLSACDSGRGEIVDGQGVMGLRRAVLSGGARDLVMSLWKVPDAEAVELMDSFYGHLGASSPAEALRAAQLETLAHLREAGTSDAVLRVASFIAAGR